jgi:hypothetical protein
MRVDVSTSIANNRPSYLESEVPARDSSVGQLERHKRLRRRGHFRGGGMPWKECHVMDERLRFVARLLEGDKMAPLCAEFGISRKTGYKIYDRYKDCGVTAFSDRSRRPHRQANRLPTAIEATIVRLKRQFPAGALGRSARSCVSSSRARIWRRSARSTRCSIARGWCNGGAAVGTRRRAPRCRGRPIRTRSVWPHIRGGRSPERWR